MKKITSTLLLLMLLLVACTSTESTPTLPESTTEEASAPTVTEQVSVSREAVLSEIENNVTAQMSSSAEFTSATVGMKIPLGGAVQTGEDSRARLDLQPEGTIVRVGPNSLFSLPTLSEENGEPKTTLQLFFGKVFILLNGGSLDVETPSGVASVRGSLLSVAFDPNTSRLQASCLEGYCSLENENGDEVDLVEGESAFIDEAGLLSDVGEIDRDEVQDWLEESPELGEFLDELPNPEEFPDLEDFIEPEFEGDNDETGFTPPDQFGGNLPPLDPDNDDPLGNNDDDDGDGPLGGGNGP